MRMLGNAGRATTLAAGLSLLPLAAWGQAQPTPTPAAQAATPSDATVNDARRAYNEGSEHFNAGRYTEALTSFERAYTLRANPVVLKPIIECHERLGQVPEAIASIERYLREAPTAPDHAAMETRLRSLQQRPARVHVTSEPGSASLVLDGRRLEQRTPTDLEVAPGHHHVVLELDGYTTTGLDFDVGPGVSHSVGVSLASSAPSGNTVAPPPVAQPSRGPSPAVWVAVGVAGAAAITGTVFGVIALSDANSYDRQPTRDLYDSGRRNAVVADVAFATSIVSAGVAVVAYFATRHRGEQRPTAGLRLAPTGLRVDF